MKHKLESVYLEGHISDDQLGSFDFLGRCGGLGESLGRALQLQRVAVENRSLQGLRSKRARVACDEAMTRTAARMVQRD